MIPGEGPGDLRENRLLAALPAAVVNRFRSAPEPVGLVLGQVIYEPDEALSHVYFPTTTIVSLLYTMENDSSPEQQPCRWLLLGHDRLKSDELVMSQELIANMLGVRREGVSAAAQRLQQAGLIRYRRGRITSVDRRGPERAVCECYQVVRQECDRLLTC